MVKIIFRNTGRSGFFLMGDEGRVDLRDRKSAGGAGKKRGEQREGKLWSGCNIREMNKLKKGII